MQNSIWKLTALAGVIGVGFLIVLQAQNGIERPAPSTQQQAANGTPEVGNNGLPPSENAASLWPAGSSETDATTRKPSPASPYLAQSDTATTDSFSPSARRAANPYRNDIQPVEYQPESPRPRRSIPVIDDTQDNSPRGDPFVSESPREDDTEAESPRAKAARLMAEATTLKDAGSLTEARELLVEANELPVSFGPLEDRPTLMIKEIDMLLRAKSRQPKAAAVETTTELLRELGNASKIRRTANQVAPLFQDDTSEPSVATAQGTDGKSDSAVDEPPRLLGDDSLTPTEDSEKLGKKPRPFLPTADTRLPSEPLPTLSLDEDNEASTAPERTRIDAEPLKSKPALPQPPKPHLTIDKSAPPDAVLGKPMIYSIVVTNKGLADAAQVTIDDIVPTGCELVGSIPQAELAGKKLSWKLGRLAVGESKKVLVKVIPREEGEIGSHATVNFVTDATSIASELKQTSAESKPVRTGSPLRLAVFGPEEVRIGEPIKLKFKVTNISDRDLTEVNLQNLIPNGLQHSEGNDLTYPIGRLAAGASSVVELELKSARAGDYTNRAILSAAGGIQSESTSSVKVLDSRGLRVEAIESTSMPIGQPTTQEVRLINESSLDITGVTVTEVLPENLRFVKATGNGAYDAANRKIQWRLDRVPAGETAILKITVQPTTAGPHACQIEVQQSGQTKSSIIESRIQARGVSVLKLDIDHSHSTTSVGEEFTVDITLRNRGTGPDSNLNLSLLLPPEVEFVQAKSPVRNKPLEAARGGARLLTFHPIPELGDRAASDFQVVLRARSAGKAKIRAEVNSDGLSESVASEVVVVVFDAAE